MGLSVWRIILIIAVIICVVLAVTFHVIALATDYWLQSSAPHKTNFLNIGLWRACFVNYRHPHEEGSPPYHGCHDLYSDTYKNIRDWLIPGKIAVCFFVFILCTVMLYKLQFLLCSWEWLQSIMMSTSVDVGVSMSVCLRGYLWHHMCNLYQFFVHVAYGRCLILL